eukprot:4089594-Prymnesium_polylepis.2
MSKRSACVLHPDISSTVFQHGQKERNTARFADGVRMRSSRRERTNGSGGIHRRSALRPRTEEPDE